MVAVHRTEAAFLIVFVVNRRTETTFLLKWSQIVVLNQHVEYFLYEISTLNHSKTALLSNPS